MALISQDSVAAIQPELLSGESIVWAGQPHAGVFLHKEDIFLIPFSLLWGGFAIVWEAGVSGYWGSNARSGEWLFGMVWGIPFVLIGQYMIWGRFLYAAWKKKRIHYALTTRRVIVVHNGWKREMSSAYLDNLPALIKEGGSNGIGTLRFAQQDSMWSGRRGWGAWDSLAVGNVPTFMDIDDVDSVYRLVSDMREKTREAKVMG